MTPIERYRQGYDLSTEDFMKVFGCSKASTWRLIKQKKLETYKIGNLRRITNESARALREVG